MSARSISFRQVDISGWRIAAVGLILAALLVGIAIAIGGSAARALNGVGAIVWLVSAVLLAMSLPEPARRNAGWVIAGFVGVLLGAVVRPGSLAEAVVWIAIAGVVVVLAAGDRTGAWALLAPAIYLPAHLLTSVGRAFLMSGGVRTDPPPTAAILPLVMVLSAAAAGAALAAFVRRTR